MQYAKLRHNDVTSKFSSVDSFHVPAGRDVLMHTDNNTSQPPITSRHTLTRYNTPYDVIHARDSLIIWRHYCGNVRTIFLFNYIATHVVSSLASVAPTPLRLSHAWDSGSRAMTSSAATLLYNHAVFWQ